MYVDDLVVTMGPTTVQNNRGLDIKKQKQKTI